MDSWEERGPLSSSWIQGSLSVLSNDPRLVSAEPPCYDFYIVQFFIQVYRRGLQRTTEPWSPCSYLNQQGKKYCSSLWVGVANTHKAQFCGFCCFSFSKLLWPESSWAQWSNAVLRKGGWRQSHKWSGYKYPKWLQLWNANMGLVLNKPRLGGCFCANSHSWNWCCCVNTALR